VQEKFGLCNSKLHKNCEHVLFEIMIWESMSFKEKEKIVIIDGIIN
jgi:hypothetical protein